MGKLVTNQFNGKAVTALAELPLWQRLELAHRQLEPVQSNYRIVFESDLDHPAAVLIPDPNWLACALQGGILPPVHVYHDLEYGENGRVLNGHILHETPPIAAMSEEEAIEYLIQKDVPAHIWKQDQGNSVRLLICRKTQLPATRNWRNAWNLIQEKAA
ncbi:hypothetical protein [Terasakiella pusilla]|jgi:hypothetical protein|uniref:hypothetical protein n=1 Tax=Terasakiella pusilla TaxID=64973 RepID=UPI003AA81A9B